LLVNDNKPALELVEVEVNEDDWEDEDDGPEYANKGVKIITDMPDDEEDEAQAALNEYRLRMAALLPTATSVPT